MKSYIVDHYIASAQEKIYDRYHNYFPEPRFIGRLGAIPFIIIDGVLNFCKTPLKAIESLAFCVANSVKYIISCWKQKYKQASYEQKDASYYGEKFLIKAVNTPVKLITLPSRITAQIGFLIYNPKELQTINISAKKDKELKELIV